MLLVLGVAIIAAAIYAVLRKVDVRLALLCAGLLLGAISGQAAAVVQKFFSGMTNGEYVIPLCSAMGFAHVLRLTECDQHLVRLLVRPLRRVRSLLIPGAVAVGFLVNIPVVSQTSTAVSIGSVLIPLLLAARVTPETAGAALLLGASIGGELLNQGAPEFRTIIQGTSALGYPAPSGARLVGIMLPFNLLHLGIATLVFWGLSRKFERAAVGAEREEPVPASTGEELPISLMKAAVPLLPLALLFLVAEPFRVLEIPREWLVGPKEAVSILQDASETLKQPSFARAAQEAFSSRLIGAAMIVGVVVAALTDFRKIGKVAGSFFEGAGYAYANIVSLIVVATCFGEGIKQIGLDQAIHGVVRGAPGLLVPSSVLVSMGFAFVSGSGIAATQSLFRFFGEPAGHIGVAPEFVGVLVSLGAAAGRTMSPVAAVALMSGSLTGTSAAVLVKRVSLPLLAGMAAVILAGLIAVSTGRFEVTAPATP